MKTIVGIVDGFFAKLFLILASICLTFLVVEYLSRFFFQSYSPVGDYVQYDLNNQPAPYTMFKPRVFYPFTNELGYRGKVPGIKQKGVYRIFMVGGSTVYNGNPTIPELLENIIGEQKVEVFNYGVPSAKSGEELARIVFEIADHSPDLVIIYDGGNDLYDPCGDERPTYPFNFVVYENNPLMIDSIAEYPTGLLFAYGSNFFRSIGTSFFIQHFISDKINYQHPSHQERANLIVDNYLKNITKAHHIARSLGFELVVFFQPLNDYRKYYQETGFNYYQGPAPEGQAGWNSQALLYARRLLLEKIKTGKRNSFKDFNFIDLSNFYNRESGDIFHDWIHTRQEYKPAIATRIYQDIKRFLKNGPG